MNQPEKGMSSDEASRVKRAGHRNEDHYAQLIGGYVVRASRKPDVVDRSRNAHSVKSGKKWQIFLYGRDRLAQNTAFRKLGNVAQIMVDCIDTLPDSRDDRESDRDRYKAALQAPMRALANELQDKQLLIEFFMKAAFDTGEVDYWAILPPNINQRYADRSEKCFHVFAAKQAVEELCRNMQVENSQARGRGQTAAQKVVFKDRVIIGEIELRTDKGNYGRMKMWLDAERVIDLLKSRIPSCECSHEQVIAYGDAEGF